jgi:hypothetical protein
MSEHNICLFVPLHVMRVEAKVTKHQKTGGAVLSACSAISDAIPRRDLASGMCSQPFVAVRVQYANK